MIFEQRDSKLTKIVSLTGKKRIKNEGHRRKEKIVEVDIKKERLNLFFLL